MTTRSPKEHHGSPCNGSVKSAGPLCCHTQMGNNQAHRTKCLWQDVGTISTGMLFIKSLQYNLPDISSYLLDLKLFTDTMQLVLTATCYNFGLITIKSSLLGRKTLTLIEGRLIPLAMTAWSRTEINPTIFDTCHRLFVSFPQSHQKAFVEDLNAKWQLVS